jgi:tRNA pseudouridine38-40 synthase
VQSEVEQALRSLGWQGKHIKFAGRTDSGVHASGQVIAFDLEWNHPPEALQQALNAHFPEDLAARHVSLAPMGFDPRRHAHSRTYAYRVFFDRVRDPLRERYAWRLWPPLALEPLQQAASLLVGTHDFAAFGTPPRTGSSTVRTVFQSEWQSDAAGLVYRVTANAFLYHMVRRMVHLQAAVAQGRLALETLAILVHSPQEGNQIITVQGFAPAQGLFLEEVNYTE